MFKEDLIKKIKENSQKENVNVSIGDFYFGWWKTVAFARTEDGTETKFIDEKDCDIPEIEIRKGLANSHEISIDDTGVYYEYYVDILLNDKRYTLMYFDGAIGIDGVISDLLERVESKEIESRLREIKRENFIHPDYNNKELWLNKNKDYKDNQYVAIVRTEGNDKWAFNDLFEYIENNYKDECYKIYQLRKKTKVIYISKEKLGTISHMSIPNNLKDDINFIVSKKCNCGLCENTTYVNTLPYVYDSCVGSTGRLYACPVCLDLYDTNIFPEYSLLNSLNGDEKMDLLDYAHSAYFEL